jgi:SPP1 gp7 family putative phage head morphogenesis protein
MRSLRKVARASGHIVGVHIDGVTIRDEREMRRQLSDYARVLGPWARRQSAKMLERVSKANSRAMRSNAKKLGQGLRLVAESDVGQAARTLMEEQVALIQSIPIRAGQRAQELARSATFSGERASEVAKELQRTTEVSEVDATRIARTEVARSNTALIHARATRVGSTQYIWRTSRDESVRHAHKLMEGKVVDWAHPPTLEDGTSGHAGTFPNCRCYPEPFFPND